MAGTKLLIDTVFGSDDCFTNSGHGPRIKGVRDWRRWLELEVIDDFNIYIFTGVFGQSDVVLVQLVGAADVDVVAISPNRIQLVRAIGMTDQEADYRVTRPGEPDCCVFDVSISEEGYAAIAGAVVNHDDEFAVGRENALDDCVITVSVLHRIATANDEREENEKEQQEGFEVFHC